MATEGDIAENMRRALQAGHEADMKHPVPVLLLLETSGVQGRLEAEFKMPDAPVPKLQIGRGGVCRVESVRYSPADGLYVCRCALCWPEGERPKDAAEIIAFLKGDTGLEWEVK